MGRVFAGHDQDAPGRVTGAKAHRQNFSQPEAGRVQRAAEQRQGGCLVNAEKTPVTAQQQGRRAAEDVQDVFRMVALAQGFLEMSNVEVVDEMVNMIVGQRAYEVNSKSIQTSDSMLGIAVQLKRS